MTKGKHFVVEICPDLLKRWKENNLFHKQVMITKTDINRVSNKLVIFCNMGNHNCFVDKRVRKNPESTLVVRGTEVD